MLSRLKERTSPIKVVIVGMGAMGKGLLYQCLVTPGIECVGVADIVLDKAVDCLAQMHLDHEVVQDVGAFADVTGRGKVAACADADLLARAAGADVFLDASNAIVEAGRFAVTAIEHGKHLVLMNAEVDLVFGPYLMRLAHNHEVVYTSCDGDQHGVIKRLIDDMSLWGFQPVMGGNIKGFLDRYANPTSIVPEADKRNLDYRMCTAYTDGTKLNIEMALLANALGMRSDVTGMHGPRAGHVKDVFALFDFEALWQDGVPVVDYILGGQPDGGVFAIGYSDHPYQQSMLQYYKMGDGPFYLFYRPYHLCHVEAMQCVAEAVLDGYSLLEPTHGLRTNVFAYAKRDLRPGQVLDGIGGHCCYGMIQNCPTHGTADGLPIGMAEDVTVKRDIEKDQPILLADVQYDADRFDFNILSNSTASTA